MGKTKRAGVGNRVGLLVRRLRPFPDSKYRDIYAILNVCTVIKKIEGN